MDIGTLNGIPEGYYTIMGDRQGYKTGRTPVVHIRDDETVSVPLMILEPE